jgi:hypothetical protein
VSCGQDLRHGFKVGDRVVLRTPLDPPLHGTIFGFAIDKCDVQLDGSEIMPDGRAGGPMTTPTKWLERESGYPDVQGMIHELHEAIFGLSWARPDSPAFVWHEMIAMVTRRFADSPERQYGDDLMSEVNRVLGRR